MVLHELVCFDVFCVYECAWKESICKTCHTIQYVLIFPQPDFQWFLVFMAALLDESGFEQIRRKWLRYLVGIKLHLETHVFTCRIYIQYFHFFSLNWQSHGNTKSYTLAETSNFQLNMYVMWNRNMSAATLLRQRWTSWICLFVQSLHGWIPVIWGSTSSTKGKREPRGRWSEEFVNLGCQACIPGAPRKGFCFEVLLSSHSTSALTVSCL